MMRWVIALLLLFPASAFATLSAVTDANGRVTLTITQTPSTGVVWSISKNGTDYYQISTTGAGTQTITENRPGKYQFIPISATTSPVSFSFHGTSLYAPTQYISSDAYSEVLFLCTIDGNSVGWKGGVSGGIATISTSLTDAEHSVSCQLNGYGYCYDEETGDPVVCQNWGSNPQNLLASWSKGFLTTNFEYSTGDILYYRAFIDGSVTENTSVSPDVNPAEALQERVDELIAGGHFVSYPDNRVGDSSLLYDFILVATAYQMTQDSRLPDIAAQMKTYYDAVITATGGYFGTHIQENGWQTFATHAMWKAFDSSAWKTAAENSVAFALNTWPKVLNGILSSHTAEQHITMNTREQISPLLGLTLMYDDTASTYYHSSALYDLLYNNLWLSSEAGVPVYNAIKEDGKMDKVYFHVDTSPAIYDHTLAMLAWPAFYKLKQVFGWDPNGLITALTNWCNSGTNFSTNPIAEPYFYLSEVYGNVEVQNALRRTLTEYIMVGSVPVNFRKLLYSAAWRTANSSTGGTWNYKPLGWDKISSSAYLAPMDSIFEGIAIAKALNIPEYIWYDGQMPLLGRYSTAVAGEISITLPPPPSPPVLKVKSGEVWQEMAGLKTTSGQTDVSTIKRKDMETGQWSN